MELMRCYRSFVNGKFSDSDGSVRADRSPTDGSVVAELVYADDAVLNQAVDAARAAFQSWGVSDRAYRAGVLNKMADVMEQNKAYLASIEARDVGKPIGEATMQMEMCASMYRYFAAAILSQDDTMVVHDGGSVSLVLREPLGAAQALGAALILCAAAASERE